MGSDSLESIDLKAKSEHLLQRQQSALHLHKVRGLGISFVGRERQLKVEKEIHYLNGSEGGLENSVFSKCISEEDSL
jgi:hypothetical protein